MVLARGWGEEEEERWWSKGTKFQLHSLSSDSLRYSLVVVHALNSVWLFLTQWTVTCKDPLPSTVSCSLLKLMSIESRCHPTISSCATPSSFCLQSFPASGSFLMSQLFISGGQSIGASALATVLPKNIQGWPFLELTGLISLQSKGLSRVLSSSTIWKH